MGTKINLTNQRFGRLTVIQDSGKRTGGHRHGYGHVIYGCRCDCGNWINAISGNLRNGRTQSCGCLSREQAKAQGRMNVKHGDCKGRIYHTWQGMKRKCYNSHAVSFKRNGGAGIKICKAWLDKKRGFINFRTWALSNGYTFSLRYYRISRKDCEKNFSPSNCRITSKTKWLKI